MYFTCVIAIQLFLVNRLISYRRPTKTDHASFTRDRQWVVYYNHGKPLYQQSENYRRFKRFSKFYAALYTCAKYLVYRWQTHFVYVRIFVRLSFHSLPVSFDIHMVELNNGRFYTHGPNGRGTSFKVCLSVNCMHKVQYAYFLCMFFEQSTFKWPQRWP